MGGVVGLWAWLCLRGGVDIVFDMAWGGPFLVTFVAKCAWSGQAANVVRRGRSALALPWWVFARTSGEAQGNGGAETP
jgi:hypothetical protein